MTGRSLPLLLALLISACAPSEPETLAEWLAVNEPRALSYLRSLSPEDRGKTAAGVELTGGERALTDLVYQGRVYQERPGTEAWRFTSERDGRKLEVHYLWLDAAATLMTPPDCAGSWVVPNGIAVLSGDVYTWREIRPGQNLVVTTCDVTG